MVDLTAFGGLLAFAATAGVILALLNQAFGIGGNWWAVLDCRQAQAGYHYDGRGISTHQI